MLYRLQLIVLFLCSSISYSQFTNNQPLDTVKRIVGFSFKNSHATTKIIDSVKSIIVNVPFGTDVSALFPEVNYKGVSIEPKLGADQDFIKPVLYKIKAKDSSVQEYTIKVIGNPVMLKDFSAAYKNQDQIVLGIIGNSKGCGFRQTGWELLVPGGENLEKNGLLTQVGQDNPEIHGWAQELQRWLKHKNSTSIIYNYSGSGWTTRNHLEFGTVQKLAAKLPKPDIVFVQLQVNDRLKDIVSVSPLKGGISWEEFKSNTEKIVTDLLNEGILPILVKEDNVPFTNGKGWKWSEYDTGMNAPNTGTNDGTHRSFSEYVRAIGSIALDEKWLRLGVGPLRVLDCYTPSLNTGQESRYHYMDQNGVFDEEDGLAPEDFRYSLMRGWFSKINDVWHQNDFGGELILETYKTFFRG